MEVAQWFNLSLLFFLLILLVLYKIANPRHLPPSPPALPIIGHLHLLKQPVHRTLQQLSERYGDILLLRYGSRKVLVISSPSAVEECFTKNDMIFANRPSSLAGKHLNYNSTTMGFSSYGDHWRNLRRLTNVELFSSSRLATFSGIRTEEVRSLLKQLFQDYSDWELIKVQLTSKFTELTFNIVMRIIAGKRMYGKDADSEEARLFHDLIREMESLRGSANLNDYFPVLQWMDFGGVEKKMKALMKKMDRFLQDLVDEHQRARSESFASGNLSVSSKQNRNMTLIDVLLSLKETEPEFYSDQTIKGVIMTTLTAGTQTSAATMEWAISLLLSHQEAMQKVYAEIDAIVGRDRLLDETDVPNPSYLQNVINETFRLFPPAPLLLPHESNADCTVCGFHVPRVTMLLVNTWSMNRNPKMWKEPTKFMTERFDEGGEGAEGYKLLPFGAGRRACPGAGLAKRVIGLTLGALIQSFEWEKVSKEEINMAEGTGLTMPKAQPLQALCKPRKDVIHLLSTL